MDNPYHEAATKPHYLDRELCRIKCFDLFNIVAASASLAGQYEMAEPEEPIEPSPMFHLHHRLAEPRLSQLLLEIAVFVRTFDDVMGSIAPDEYAAFSAATDGGNFIGTVNEDGGLKLREACNKIIHATDFRPVYDHAERGVPGQEPIRVWHLDGQIELEGVQGKKPWEAVLYINNFLEIVLARLEFEPPEDDGMGPIEIKLRDRRRVFAHIDETGQVKLLDAQGAEIGHVSNRPIDEDDDNRLLITNIYLEGPDGSGAYKRQGIMACVLNILVEADYTLFVRSHDGIVRDDGSHLTQEAPSFFDEMEKRGLVRRYDGP
jgi:hypothetical protein